MSEYPQGIADGPQIEANLQYILNDLKTPFGEKYKVVRIPAPADFEGEYPDSQSGDYFRYGSEVEAATLKPVRAWSSYHWRGKTKAKDVPLLSTL